MDVGATDYPVAPVGDVLLGLVFEAPAKRKVAVVAPFVDPVDEHWSEATAPGPEAPPPVVPGAPEAPPFPGEPQ